MHGCDMHATHSDQQFCPLQGELLASSQAKVVELHDALSRHARNAGISDEQLMVDSAKLKAELESSLRHSQECEGYAAFTISTRQCCCVNAYL